MPPFEKVTRGDSWQVPYAEEWNAMLDAAIATRHQHVDRAASALRALPHHTILVRNDTGGDLPRFGVVAIAGPVFTPSESLASFKSDYALVGVLPAAEHAGRFAIVTEPIAQGRYGQAAIDGVVPVQIAVGHDVHDYADIEPASREVLQSGFRGAARILWKEPGTQTRWALVELGIHAAQEITAVADVDILPGSSGLATVYRAGASSAAKETVHLAWMHGGEQVSAGKKLIARWFADWHQWLIVAAECES